MMNFPELYQKLMINSPRAPTVQLRANMEFITVSEQTFYHYGFFYAMKMNWTKISDNETYTGA